MPHGVPLVVVFLSRLAGIPALSERRASNQRNQRESSDKHLHDTSPCYGRSTGLAVENVQSIDLNGFVRTRLISSVRVASTQGRWRMSVNYRRDGQSG